MVQTGPNATSQFIPGTGPSMGFTKGPRLIKESLMNQMYNRPHPKPGYKYRNPADSFIDQTTQQNTANYSLAWANKFN